MMVKEMRKGVQLYSEEEAASILEARALFGTFVTGTGKARSIKTSKTVELARTKFDRKPAAW